MQDTLHPVAENVLWLIRKEYHELPGLRLTLDQAQRLWALDRKTCGEALNALIEEHFLLQAPDGRFVRSALSSTQGLDR